MAAKKTTASGRQILTSKPAVQKKPVDTPKPLPKGKVVVKTEPPKVGKGKQILISEPPKLKPGRQILKSGR